MTPLCIFTTAEDGYDDLGRFKQLERAHSDAQRSAWLSTHLDALRLLARRLFPKTIFDRMLATRDGNVRSRNSAFGLLIAFSKTSGRSSRHLQRGAAWKRRSRAAGAAKLGARSTGAASPRPPRLRSSHAGRAGGCARGKAFETAKATIFLMLVRRKARTPTPSSLNLSKTGQNRPEPRQLRQVSSPTRPLRPKMTPQNLQNRSKPSRAASTETSIEPDPTATTQNDAQKRTEPIKTAQTRVN